MSELSYEKEAFEHLWKYFSLHADQRMKTVNFFIVISGVLIAAIVRAYTSDNMNWYVSGCSLLVTLLSYIFYRIDCRNKDLIKLSEQALIEWEKQYLSSEKAECCKLFSNEKIKTEQSRTNDLYLTYSNALNILFSLVGIAGFLLFLVPILK